MNVASDSERLQKALDRYGSRHKSAEEIGRDYERFVGYKLEREGFKVVYFGARQGLNDLGRDLIVQKSGFHFLVQCKLWSKKKTIHEKHIYQLFGSLKEYEISAPKGMKDAKAIFVTSAQCSEVAREKANTLGISILDGVPLQKWPMIKCNISRNGDRIFHIPTDQMYDKIIIGDQPGEFYAWTIEEAAGAGFRHAKRYMKKA